MEVEPTDKGMSSLGVGRGRHNKGVGAQPWRIGVEVEALIRDGAGLSTV
jgi:hypothetical protein